jgi:hypothetical protein
MFFVAFLCPFPQMLTLNPAKGHGRCLSSQFIIPQLDALSHTHCYFILLCAAQHSTSVCLSFCNLMQSAITIRHYRRSHCPASQIASVCPSKQYQQPHSTAHNHVCLSIQTAPTATQHRTQSHLSVHPNSTNSHTAPHTIAAHLPRMSTALRHAATHLHSHLPGHINETQLGIIVKMLLVSDCTIYHRQSRPAPTIRT